MAGIEPTLAAKIRANKGIEIFNKDRATVTWPKLISVKIDGIRGTNRNGDKLLSRTYKPLPNRHLQRRFGNPEFLGLDGEGIHGAPYEVDGLKTVMQRAESAVMSVDGPVDTEMYAFDVIAPGPYEKRWAAACERWKGVPHLHLVEQTLIYGWDEADEFFAARVAERFEGAMLRDPRAEYLNKRSTLRENVLIKLKEFEDAEAKIVGFEELYSNQNEQTKNELGRSKRSSHQENQVPMNMLGSFICESPLWPGVTFKIGTGVGLTLELRREIWADRAGWMGSTITFAYHKMRSFQRPSLPQFKSRRRDLA